ncbi:MAG: TrkH family potassium uptake protein [Rubrobacteraceae bacterium]
MHPRVIASAIGAVVAVGGSLMLVPTIYAFFANDGTFVAFGLPALVSMAVGVAVFIGVREPDSYVSAQDVFLIVVLGWIGVACAGSIPLFLAGLMTPLEAFFEAMAGFTTTGASTIIDLGSVAPSLLLWRSLMQWAGGIGIVVLFVAVGPLVGFGASQLLSAEIGSPVPERLTPRIRDTARNLAVVYLGLTLGGIVALFIAGMSLFDAVNHSFTTVATGGYSTREGSIGGFDSWAIELAVVVGMLLSGTNFALYYVASQGRWRRAIRDPELLAYLGIAAAGTVIVTVSLYVFDYRESLVEAFRDALFQSVSLLTGTAFSTATWSEWDPLSLTLLILFMAMGGCAGSTSGGIKIIRCVLLARHGRQQIFHMLHPQAVTPLKLQERTVSEQLRISILGFFFVYMLTLAVGTLIMAAHQIPLAESFGSVFACINITGTFVGDVGDSKFYAALPATAKLTLTIFMLLGRLELLTVLVILTPSFWRSY